MSINRCLDKENEVYKHNGVLFSHKEEQNSVICKKIDGSGDHLVEENKSYAERQMSCILLNM